MADYNQNQDWDQQRQRSNQENDQNRSRNHGNSQQGNNAYGSMRDEDMDMGYGGTGQRGWQQTGDQGNSYGNREQGENRYNNDHSNWQDRGWDQASPGNRQRMASNDNRSSQGRGEGYRQGGSNYGRQNQARNMYGGDTSNYGNANQGGFDREWWDKAKNKISSWLGGDDNDTRSGNRSDAGMRHAGKGPKNYERSQDRIREDVCDRLTDDGWIDASNIEVQVQGSEVILNGTVQDREQKRRAEDVVESVSGVRHVENRIRVDRGNESSTGNYNRGTTDL